LALGASAVLVIPLHSSLFETVYRYNGRILKKIELCGGGWVDIVARADATFRFYERRANSDLAPQSVHFESGSYVTADAAEAAVRLKLKL
jgi:hypothetical protein